MEREGERDRERVRIVGTRQKDELDGDKERDNGRETYRKEKRDGVKEERKKRDGDDEDVDIQMCRLCSGDGAGRTFRELIKQRTERETRMQEGVLRMSLWME